MIRLYTHFLTSAHPDLHAIGQNMDSGAQSTTTLSQIHSPTGGGGSGESKPKRENPNLVMRAYVGGGKEGSCHHSSFSLLQGKGSKEMLFLVSL